MSKPILKRDEMDPADQWNTADIFPSDDAWRQALDAAYAYVPRIEAYRGRLAESGETLLGSFRLKEEIGTAVSRIHGYASLRADEDTGNAVYQDMRGKAQRLGVALQTASAFETPELLALSDENLSRFYLECPDLTVYRRAIDDVRRFRGHVLSEREESLLAAAGEMSETPYRVFNLFTGADLHFPPAVDTAGECHPLTQGTLVTLLHSPDRVLRESAFRNFYEVYRGMRNTPAALLDAQAKQLQFFADARGYASARAAALFENNVPESVYDSLLASVHRNLPSLHRYMALRRRLMGLDELHMYDIYTPLVPSADLTVPFEDAKSAVLEACSVLGSDYTAVLREAFKNRWIDVYENTGKRSGAYSSGISEPHPYVLLNYKDTLDSAFTLAHEMGHAMHSWLSTHAQRPIDRNYVIFVAEVASTVNESLLMQSLLRKTSDRAQRAYLINYFLEQFRTTLFRQAQFAEFEKQIGELCRSGETLTAETLNERYLALNRLYYGEEVCSDELIALEWARVPHFYYNYYVYQYATGFSAAMAISRRILTQGESAVRDYLSFLSGGCSQSPIELLRLAGADMTVPAPVDAALALFDELIGELEKLTD